ncbi:unnamed protein product [Caenorhabditis brenneri]
MTSTVSEAKNAQIQFDKKLAMNQSTVPHSEVGLRLTICKEFLTDEKKPIEELYGSWMRRIGGKLIEFEEFKYWCRRFQNDQFDLGYDTSLDSKEISEIQSTMVPEANGKKDVSTMTIESEEKSGDDKTAIIPNEIASETLKTADYRFDVQNVPVIFQELVRSMSEIRFIQIRSSDSFFQMFINESKICFERNAGGLIEYYDDENNKKTFTTTTEPEKSVIDHMWFILRNPNWKLNCVYIKTTLVSENPLKDFERILSSMLDSFDHRLYISALDLYGLNEDTFISFLKRVEPERLWTISFDISWKEKGNYQKMKEIVETEQWKQAGRIQSLGITPLTVDDVLPFENSYLRCDKITPEDVVRARDYFLESLDGKHCFLRTFENQLHYDEFENALQSKNLHARVVRKNSIDYFYTLPHSKKFLQVTVNELTRQIVFFKTPNCK